MLFSTGGKNLSKTVAHRKKKSTVNKVHAELQRLRQRVEDLEDLRDLDSAIERNAGKPGIPWDQVKKELGL